MDMDASHNWLAFSLSHHQPSAIFDAFNTSYHPAAGSGEEGGEEGELSAALRPKLEDFLGGASAAEESVPETSAGMMICDSDLKAVAVGLLRGDPMEPLEQQAPASSAAESAQEGRKAVDTFGQRTSIYRGVTRHRWTGRYEAHLWDNSCRREGQSRKGRQVYLGGYDKEEKAARAYDLAALKYWGSATTTNFPVSNYEKELEEMKTMTRQEFVASLRRKSSGFSRGASIYRGVTRHHQHGRWQARIGRVAGNKDLYLGTFSTQEEAAEAYDIAAIKFRGPNAVTNFDMSRYDVKSIASSELPVGGGTASRAPKTSESSPSSPADTIMAVEPHSLSESRDGSSPSSSFLSFAHVPFKLDHEDYWSLFANYQQYHQQQPIHHFGAASNGLMAAGTLVCGNGVLQQEQEESKESFNTAISAVPHAAPSGGSYGVLMSSFGSWVAPSSSSSSSSSSSYYPQASNANVSFFQTPIFGIE